MRSKYAVDRLISNPKGWMARNPLRRHAHCNTYVNNGEMLVTSHICDVFGLRYLTRGCGCRRGRGRWRSIRRSSDDWSKTLQQLKRSWIKLGKICSMSSTRKRSWKASTAACSRRSSLYGCGPLPGLCSVHAPVYTQIGRWKPPKAQSRSKLPIC